MAVFAALSLASARGGRNGRQRGTAKDCRTLQHFIAEAGYPASALENSLFTLSIEGSFWCLTDVPRPLFAAYTSYMWAIESCEARSNGVG